MAVRGGGGGSGRTGSRSGGAKFTSVNLSRSYGRPTAVATPSGRPSALRPPSQSGMVVLSRSSLGPPKGARLLLAVPPPINLPSLQREHLVKNPTVPADSTSGGGGAVGGSAVLGVAGWSKQKSESSGGPNNSDPPLPGRANNVYVPPGARKGMPEILNHPPRSLEKATVLKGEDFPSLKATAAILPLPLPKQRLAQQPRQQEKPKEPISPPPIHISTPTMATTTTTTNPPPTLTPKQLSRGKMQPPDRSIATSDLLRRPPDPPTAPLVRLARNSDWDDDERVTSHTLRPRSDTGAPPPPMRANGLWKSGFGRDVNGLPPPPSANEPYRGRGGNFDRDYPDRTGRSDGHVRVELNRREGLGKDRSYGGGSSQQQNSFHGQSPGGFGNYFHPSLEEKGRKFQPQQQQRSFRPESGRDAWRTTAASFSVKSPYLETSPSFLLSDDFSTDLGPFRIDVRAIRKRKEGSERASLRDPERESFEAELEQVQNMLEQERQRMAEEREMAVEMARREQEERERRAREEEELRLKREEEARKAVLEMEREVIEAGMRAEAERRAREEQRCRALLEEERRKESARRKLLELEERIAKRKEEEEWKRQQENRRNQEQVATTWEDREHNHPFCAVSRAEPDDEECASSRPRSPPSLRGSSDATYSRPTSSETMSCRADDAASKTPFNWRGEPVDNNGHSSYPSSLLNGVLPSREPFRGTSKVLPLTPESIGQRQETSSRRIRSLYLNEQGSNTKEDLYYSSRYSSNVPPRYSMDNSYEREGDYKWDRGGKNRPSSTSLSSQLPGAEYRDLLPTSRSRLKQPHVPPPLVQAPAWRASRRAENEQAHGYGGVSSQPRVIFKDGGEEETGSEADVEVEKGVGRGVVVAVAVAEEVPIEQDVICEVSECDSHNSSPAPFESAFDETRNCGVAVQIVGASEESQSSHMEDEESGEDASFQEDWVVEGAEQDDYEDEVAADEEMDMKSSPGYKEDAEGKVITEDQVDQNDIREHLEPCPSLPCSTKDAAEKDHPLEEEEEVREEDHSGLNNHGSLFLSNPLEPVQLRQPFPFMAVPLPQSNTNNTATQQASVLSPSSSNHGLQSQPDIPFQLRFGLLPGTTLMPSAIQIGSIQMPLHLHPQVPQLAPPLHASQPPLFQFGQIGHSGPFSQPPLFPPPMHIHHSASQISHSQSYNSDSSIYSSANEEMQIAGQGGGGVLHHEIKNLNLSRLEHSGNKEMVSDNSCTCIPSIMEQVTADQTEVSVVNRDQETSSKQSNGESHLDMRRKGSSSQFGKTNGFDEPLEFDEEIKARNGERAALSRPGHRSFRQAEFKPKEDPFLDEHSSDITSSGSKHLQASGGFVGLSSKNFISRDAQFDQERKMIPNRSSFIDERMTLGGAASSQFGQNGGKGNHGSVIKPPVIASNVGLPSHPRLSDGSLKSNVGPAATGDVPLQSSLDYVFEQPGIETRSTEDSFTEVRSKRHMLNDKRDQQDKEIKTWNKDSKISDHGLHKLSQKPISTSPKMSNVQPVEKRLSLHRPDIEAPSLDMRQSPSGAMLQTQSTNAAQLLGVTAGGSCDVPDKKLKGSRSVQGNLVVGSNWISSTDGSTSESHYAAVLDNAANSTNAWGGQQSVHQIHLEEVLKPASLEGPLLQKSSLSERTAPVREKFTAAVPGSIGSLLAGEKIQFGAVTSPPIMLSSPHSHAPSIKLPAISSSLSSDAKDVKCQRENTQGSVENVPLRRKQARIDEDKPRDPADAETKFAASAAAATSSNESIGNACRTDMKHGSLARMTTSVPGSSFDKSVGCANPDVLGVMTTAAIEDSVALSLPVDLSVEAPSSTLRGPLHNVQTSSGLMLPPFSSGVSHSPCLEMGTMLSGQPFFSLAPCEDALSMSQQGIKPVPSFSGHGGGMGLASVGWQQRHSTGVDSFYSGQPSGFPGTFISPGNGVPGIQGPPHMLVYTNPFASVGQFGQLGVGFMGTAYLPSGKQPDWTHTPTVTSTSQGESHVGDGELRNSVGGGIASQPCSSVINNGQHQHVGLGGSSVMPISPLNLYDFSLSNPYQMANRDAMMESQWSYVPAQPLQSVPLSGPLMGHLMQSWNLGGLPSQIPAPQMAQMNPGLHPFSLAQPHNGSSNNTFLSADSAARFSDELGLEDSVSSNMGSLGPRSPNGEPGVSSAPGISQLQQNTRSLRGGNNLFSSNIDDNGNAMMDVGMVSSLSVSHNDSTLSASEVHSFPSTHRVGYDEDRFSSSQSMARMNAGNQWPAGGHRKGPAGQASAPDRTSFGEKPFPLQPKVKQVYVAKHVSSSL